MNVNTEGFGSKKNQAKLKEQRQKEIEALKNLGNDVDASMNVEGSRWANSIQKGMTVDPVTGTARQGKDVDGFVSPSTFLNGGSPRLNNFVAFGDDDCVQFEGEMIRKASESKLKKYWYCLLGKELYVYKNKAEEKHKGMHNLIGVFINDDPEEHLDE